MIHREKNNYCSSSHLIHPTLKVDGTICTTITKYDGMVKASVASVDIGELFGIVLKCYVR